MQINNIITIVSDPELEDIRRRLYVNFLLDRFAMLRDAGIEIENVDARQMVELTHSFNEFQPTWPQPHHKSVTGLVFARSPSIRL